MQALIPEQEQRRLAIATRVTAVVVLLVLTYGYRKIQTDDSYIFYSYANNLANGQGYVFNPGERINATTSALYTILLALSSATLEGLPFITLPVIGHSIGALSLLLISMLLMKSFEEQGFTLFPFVLPLVFLSNPLLPNAVGMETFLAMMLGLAGLYLYMRNDLLFASMVFSFAVLARPDMLLLAAIVAAYDLIRKRRFLPIGAILVFSAPLLTWLLFSHFYFGEILPTTLSVKLSQAESGRWGEGFVFFRGLSAADFWNGRSFRNAMGASMVAGAGVLVWNFRRWSLFRNPVLHLILLWSLAYLLVYGLVLNPPAYRWYYTPPSLGMAILATLPIEGLFRLVHANRAGQRLFVAGVYLALVLLCVFLSLRTSKEGVNTKFKKYKLAAEWLNANVEEGASVGANEIGVLRYFYNKGAVIDGLGLVTPLVADHVRRRDYAWYVQRYQPDYLMFNHPHRPVLESMVEDDWFEDDYVLRTLIGNSRRSIAIYARRVSPSTTR